ncbi:MAG: carbohydrate-binding protein [Gammaproteobacteria bacterium]|nr:MAG: carbohydrate-binding protein [Gammaproteobacteria bacterium]
MKKITFNYQRHYFCKSSLFATLVLLASQSWASCSYTITSNWGSGFTSEIKVTNNTAQSVKNWAVSWKESGANITAAWNASLSGSNPYSATALSWNGTLAPNASASFGFQGEGSAAVQQVSGSLCGDSTASSSVTTSLNVSSSSSVRSSSISFSSNSVSSNSITVSSLNSSSKRSSSIASSIKSSAISSSASSVTAENSWTFEESSIGFCNDSSRVLTNHTGYTGVGFFDSENTLNATFSVSVSAASSKTYAAKIRFANGSSATRQAAIFVNDNKIQSVDFPSNSNWDQWQTLTVDVPLNAGSNNVKIISETKDGLPNIDNLIVVGNGIAPAACPTTPTTSDCNNITNQPVLKVASDGSAQFKTVTAALNTLSTSNSTPTQIRIKPGTYREKITVNKPYVTFCGETGKQASTILTYNDSASGIKSDGTTIGTYGSASVAIKTNDISIENITIENSFGVGSQAVALLAQGQRLQFRNCRLLGNQDTVYVHSGTQYYRNCYIEGTVDYIFGAATAVFDNNTIHSVGYGTAVTAPSTEQSVPFGLVFLGGKLTASSNVDAGKVALGRNWRPYGAAAYIRTELGSHVSAVGWVKMSENILDTARFSEYQTTGAGANPSARAYQSTQLTASQAATYTIANIFGSWTPSFSK